MSSSTTRGDNWYRARTFVRDELDSIFGSTEKTADEKYREAINETESNDSISERVKKIVKWLIAKFREKIDELTSTWWYRWFAGPVLRCSLGSYLCPIFPLVVDCGLGFVSKLTPELPTIVKKVLSKVVSSIATLLPDLSAETSERCKRSTAT